MLNALQPFPSSLGRHHPLLKQLSRLKEPAQRRQHGLFLVEGVRLLEEAMAASESLILERLFFRADLQEPRALRLLAACPDRTCELQPESLARLSETESCQGLVGVFRFPRPPRTVLQSLDALLVLEGVSDPGNLGTLIRAARAAGVGGVVLLGGVEPYNPKVVRSSAGAMFRLPVWQDVSLDEVVAAGFTLLAAVAHEGEDYYRCPVPAKPAWLLGGEARGLSSNALGQAATRVTLPMAGGCESLNVAMAGTVMMFDWMRRRVQT